MGSLISSGTSNVELGYAEITSNYQQTGAGASDVTGLTVTVTVGVRPVLVRLYGPSFNNSSASGITTLSIKESSTVLTVATSSLTTDLVPLALEVRLSPSAGSHTYKATLTQAITGNSIVTAAAGAPAFIEVIQI